MMMRITGTIKKIAIAGLFLLLAIVAIMNIERIKNTTAITRQFGDPSYIITKKMINNNNNNNNNNKITMCQQHLNESLLLTQHISDLYQNNIDFFQKNTSINFFIKKKIEKKERKRKKMKKNKSSKSNSNSKSESLSPSATAGKSSISISSNSSSSSMSSSESSESLFKFKSVLMDGIHPHQSSLSSSSLSIPSSLPLPVPLPLPLPSPSPLSLQNNKTNDDDDELLDLSIALTLPFRGKKIVFIGDSTLRTIWFGLKSLMTMNNNSSNNNNIEYPPIQVINDIDILSLQERIENGMDKGKKATFRSKGIVHRAVDDVNKVDMHYINLKKIVKEENLKNKLYQIIDNEMDGGGASQQQVVDLVVFNVGLHLFHLIGDKTKNINGRNSGPEEYRTWIHYDLYIKNIIKLLSKRKPKIILMKTTNRICEDKFNMSWLELSKKYNSNNNETINYCVDHVTNKLKEEEEKRSKTSTSTTNNNNNNNNNITKTKTKTKTAIITTNQIKKLCQYGTMTSKGSNYLNERMKNIINDIKNNDNEFILSNITLGIYNDHDVQSCELTDDGRHYYKTVLSRINLLANTMLNC